MHIIKREQKFEEGPLNYAIRQRLNKLIEEAETLIPSQTAEEIYDIILIEW